MTRPIVSIIIPIYNVEKFVEQSLRSALAQTYESIEFILVDDRGKDASMEVVRRVVEESPRRGQVRIVTQPQNCGASEARNAGMKVARGEYFYFMDADDIISADCIECLYEALAEAGAEVAVANFRMVGMKSVHARSFDETLERDKALKYFFEGVLLASPWNKLISRSLYDNADLRFHPGLLQEDILWAYNLYRTVRTFVPVKAVTYDYIIRSDSSSRALNSRKRIDSLLYILSVLKKDYADGRIPAAFLPSFFHFYDAWRFNTSLLLLYYAGSSAEAEKLYKSIQDMKLGGGGLKHFVLRWEFPCFKAVFKPLYFLYKKMQ